MIINNDNTSTNTNTSNKTNNNNNNNLRTNLGLCLAVRHSMAWCGTANLHTNIIDFGGFDSSTILTSRGGIPRPIGIFPEGLTQAMSVGCNVSRRIGRSESHARGYGTGSGTG